MPTFSTVTSEALSSARETYRGCTWVFDELVSTEAKRDIAYSLTCLFAGTMTTTLSVPFVTRYIIDAVATNTMGSAFVSLFWLALSLTIGTIFGSLHDHFRERAWNKNFLSVHLRLVEKMYKRTYDEIISEKSEVGAEQIESLKDKVQNILYLFLFESSIVFSTIIGATIFLFFTSPVAGLVAALQTLFNVTWFFFCNALLDEKMGVLDQEFRRFNRRLIEKLHMVSSIKAGGVEERTTHELRGEIVEPLAKDLKVWGYWFQRIDFWRRLINVLIPISLLTYGVFLGWSGGTIAAVSALMFMIAREYGFIGHLMRHLSAQVARIKATREALMKAPAFSHDVGIEFEEETTYAH